MMMCWINFVTKDDDVLDKYNEICGKIKFHNMSIYDEKYIKAKARECNGVIKKSF